MGGSQLRYGLVIGEASTGGPEYTVTFVSYMKRDKDDGFDWSRGGGRGMY